MEDPRLRAPGRPLDSVNRRLWRARGRLSRAKAAPLLGISDKTLQRIENGRTEPTLGQMRAAAELYGVSLHWLLFGDRIADPALAELPGELAELVTGYTRARFRAERVEELSQDEVRQLEDFAGLARSFGLLALGLIRRREGTVDPGNLTPEQAEQLAATLAQLRTVAGGAEEDDAREAG